MNWEGLDPTELRGEQWQALLQENASLRAELGATQRGLQEALEVIAQLRVELEATRQRIAELEAAQGQLEAGAKQAPFQKRKPPKDGGHPPVARGGRKGHRGSSRKRPERIDRTVEISAGECCGQCGGSLSGAGVRRERVIEDIVLVRPTVVTRYLIERRWCPNCRRYHESPVSEALPRHRLGLHVLLFVVYQKVALGLSYSKIQRELATYFGLTISSGELPSLVAEVARLFGPAYRALITLMRQQAVLHVDETSWPVDGRSHWLWTFVNDVVALYIVSRSRGSKVPKGLLGEEFEGVIVSDFFSAYSPLDVKKAKCWAHLLRDSHEIAKGRPPDSEPARFHAQLHQLFLDLGLALEAAALDPPTRPALLTQMRSRLLDFTFQDWSNGYTLPLAQRIRKHLDELLLWLANPAVPPTNNAAERALRPAVVTRKTSFGSRSTFGAHAFARLLSLIHSWERQGKNFFQTASSALTTACSQS